MSPTARIICHSQTHDHPASTSAGRQAGITAAIRSRCSRSSVTKVLSKRRATADFFYTPRILVFVDGSPHYRDYVQAADERKRRCLKALGYRVVVVKADDPEAGLSDLAARVSG